MQRSAIFLMAMAFVATASTPSQAQSVLSLNCHRPRAIPEKAACAQVRMTAAEQEMVAAYGRLSATLDPPAREHLKADHEAWYRTLLSICEAPPPLGERPLYSTLEKKAATWSCTAALLTERTEWLNVMPQGRDYLFVSDRARVERGKAQGVSYNFTANYPRFDHPAIDFSRVNAAFAATVNEQIDKSIPTAPKQKERSLERTYALAFATRSLLTVLSRADLHFGNDFGNGGLDVWRWATVVDITSGRAVSPRDLFVDGFERRVVGAVMAELDQQFRDQDGFAGVLTVEKIAPMLSDPQRWALRADHVDILFNPFEIGPDLYTVTLPYGRLATIIRPDGPLAGKLR